MHGRQLGNSLSVIKIKSSNDLFTLEFTIKQHVWIRFCGNHRSWKEEIIIKKAGNRLYIVKKDNNLFTRHINQLRKRIEN